MPKKIHFIFNIIFATILVFIGIQWSRSSIIVEIKEDDVEMVVSETDALQGARNEIVAYRLYSNLGIYDVSNVLYEKMTNDFSLRRTDVKVKLFHIKLKNGEIKKCISEFYIENKKFLVEERKRKLNQIFGEKEKPSINENFNIYSNYSCEKQI